MVAKKRKANLLGIGLDNTDGHIRVTHGENFHLVGGSEDTHEEMQAKCIKFNEKLDARGKEISDLEHQEFLDIAAQCDMWVYSPPPGGTSNGEKKT